LRVELEKRRPGGLLADKRNSAIMIAGIATDPEISSSTPGNGHA
jgi:hypothetical protein